MLNNKKTIVVMPAYNAALTLEDTFKSIPEKCMDDIILVDDCSKDDTVKIAENLKIKTFVHEKNLGYGANQKTCYKKAFEMDADIVVMLHPDNQYDPKLVLSIASMIAYGDYDCVIASRFLNNGAKYSKMPRYKYFANKFLTAFENLLTGAKLSEYHTGYRGYTRKILEAVPFDRMSDDFIFDNEMLSLIIYNNFKIGELSCPVRYFDEASSIDFKNSCKYGFGVIKTSIEHFLAKLNIKTKLYK